MSNQEIYTHFRLDGIPSAIAAQAADMISAKYDEFAAPDSMNGLALKRLLVDTLKLYELEGENFIATLKGKLV